MTDEETAPGAPDGTAGTEAPQKWGSLSSGDGPDADAIEFDLGMAPTAFSAKDGATYVQHAIIGGKPRIQWTGEALQTLSLTVQWYAAVVDDVEGSFGKLLKAMRERTVLTLVIGDDAAGSMYAGAHVITGIDHRVTRYDPDGAILAMEATVSLLEWREAPELEVSKVKPKAVKKKKKAAAAPGWHWDEKGNYVRGGAN